jgi:hypothetical protein
MKRKTIFFVMLLGLTGLLAIQSCKKTEGPDPKSYEAAMPANPTPAVSGILAFTGSGQTVDLTWEGTASVAPKWDVYFGTGSDPDLVATNVSGNKYTVTLTHGGVYHWHVMTTDANGVTSPDIVAVWNFDVNSNPDTLDTPSPADASIGKSCTPTITWRGTDPQNDDLTYDIYMGTSATPALTAAGLTSASYSPPAALAGFTKYYWQIVSHDPYGGSLTGPVWSFTTGALPITTYTGNYNADEPAEAYSYAVTFAMVNTTQIKTVNYWNSGWTGTFTLDLTKLTYTMPLTTWTSGYSGTESGIIDPATGNMQGTYTIWHNTTIAEQGVHTYTKL